MAGVRSRAWRRAELPVALLAAIIGAVVVNTFVAQAFYIPSASMVPELNINDRVVVSKLAYRLHAPRRGDLVVFSAPHGEAVVPGPGGSSVTRALRRVAQGFGVTSSQTELIKRVIGLPGETVAGRGGRVYVDGQRLDEPYLAVGTNTSDFGPVAVPPGRLWMMGDNRANSSDSRVFGPVPKSTVVGRAIWRVWPVNHTSFL